VLREATGVAPAAVRRMPAGENPGDGLRLSIRIQPGYDGITSDFDPGEHP